MAPKRMKDMQAEISEPPPKRTKETMPELSENRTPESPNSILSKQTGEKSPQPTEEGGHIIPKSPNDILPEPKKNKAPEPPKNLDTSKLDNDVVECQAVESKSDKENNIILKDAPIIPSHDTFTYCIGEAFESLESYGENGYHPIHLGDELGESGRYRVIHKLGWGTYGIVWLCRDSQERKYVAVKIMRSLVYSERLNELADFRLKDLDGSVPGADLLALPLDHFMLKGPNGTHHCIVLPFLGPALSSDFFWLRFDDFTSVLRSLCRQAAQALLFLHENGWCHGDFRPSNMLVRIKDLNHLCEDQLISMLGKPRIRDVCVEPGLKHPPCMPKYLVRSANLVRDLPSEYLTDQLCLIDFGESYPVSSPPKGLRIPVRYCPPEFLLGNEALVPAAGCDIWALGCALFEIRQQTELFEEWGRWKDREQFFDEGGKYFHKEQDEADYSLEWLLSLRKRERGGDKRELYMSEDEQRVFADLLRKLLEYEPDKRLTVGEALEHEWFKMDVAA
ncbi:SRSF protein kinase 2 [Cladobotryum mycophilum]|uniref:SRSF protein kinase 2 n=1 Tax=Cladobotryum mycophilum TaxID=491253 RepID=A0ABR0T0J2_9HYPO